ncbi:MAG: hypothetical protein ACO1OB_25470 [Archangium sp.]
MRLVATCACGNSAVEAVGRPIVTAVCYCDDCQEAARRLHVKYPDAPALLRADGGTEAVLFRSDRVRWLRGETLAVHERLTATSPTNRVVVSCCNAPMLMTFERGPFWSSLYRQRIDNAPPLQFLMNTRFAPDERALPKLPRAKGIPFGVAVRLTLAGAGMALSRGRKTV